MRDGSQRRPKTHWQQFVLHAALRIFLPILFPIRQGRHGDFRVFRIRPMHCLGVVAQRLLREPLREPAQLPVPMRDKLQADRRRDAGHNQQFVPHDDRRQNNQCQPADRDGRACGDAADDSLRTGQQIITRPGPGRSTRKVPTSMASAACTFRPARAAGEICRWRTQPFLFHNQP